MVPRRDPIRHDRRGAAVWELRAVRRPAGGEICARYWPCAAAVHV